MVHDAGTDPATVAAYKRLIDAGRLKTRLYVMLRGPMSMLEPEFRKGPLINYAEPPSVGPRDQDRRRRRAGLARRGPARAVQRRTRHQRVLDDAAGGDLRADAGRLARRISDLRARDRRSRQPHRRWMSSSACSARSPARAICGCATSTRRFSTPPTSRVSPAQRHRVDADDARDVGHAVGARRASAPSARRKARTSGSG